MRVLNDKGLLMKGPPAWHRQGSQPRALSCQSVIRVEIDCTVHSGARGFHDQLGLFDLLLLLLLVEREVAR